MAIRQPRLLATIGLVILILLAAAGSALAVTGRDKALEVDVAEDPSRFVIAGDHLIEEGELAGMPAYGDSFVTQGWVYPKGTLGDSDGVTCELGEDGLPASCEPEFPDKVIGEWTCYGVHVGEGAATAVGSWVVSTQIFDLGDPDVDGDELIVTDGFETPEQISITRAITGGTGRFQDARGYQEQVFLGFGEVFNVRTSSILRTK